MKKLLTRNLGLKLASLLLAFVLWFLVAQIYDPKDTVTFNNIQVRLINTELLDEEGKVYEVLDKQSGPCDGYRTAEHREIRAAQK